MINGSRTTSYVVPASIALLVLAPSASTANHFKLNCTLTFDPIATKPDPFLACGNEGFRPAAWSMIDLCTPVNSETGKQQ